MKLTLRQAIESALNLWLSERHNPSRTNAYTERERRVERRLELEALVAIAESQERMEALLKDIAENVAIIARGDTLA